MGHLGITTRVALFFLVLLGISAALSVFVVVGDVAAFRRHQETLARQSVRAVIAELSIMLNEIRRATRLFADDNQGLLWQLSQDPNDEATFSRIEAILKQHFPEQYSFTITDLDGNLLYDDFGERIGDMCRSNIAKTIHDEHAQTIVVHPGPLTYHFDIMVPWDYRGEKRGLFFKSYRLDVIARLLEVGQSADHRLVLVKTDDPALIEIAAEGGRDVIEQVRPGHLSPAEQTQTLVAEKVEGTAWTLVDILDPALVPAYRAKAMQPLAGALIVILLLSATAVLVVRKEEQRRRAIQIEIKESNDRLEEKVGERTRALTATNTALQEEIVRRDKAEALQRIFSRAADQSREIVFITDRDGVIEYVNASFEQSTGYPAAEAIGQPVSVLKSGVMQDALYARLWETILGNEHYTGIMTNRSKDDRLIYWDETITPLLGDDGAIQHFIATSRDITEDKTNEGKLKYLSECDLLTGLYNLSYFERFVGEQLSRKDSDAHHFAIIHIEIGNYAKLYEGIGHLASELLILELSKRLRIVSRENDVLARTGTNGFDIHVADLMTADEITPAAGRILRAFRRPVSIEGVQVEVSSNIGIAIHPDDGTSFDDLIKGAYSAAQRVAMAGGNGIDFYRVGMSERAAERIRLVHELRQAIERHQIETYYQPKIDVASGRIRGFESLARWIREPPLPPVPPVTFIPLLEEIGQIGQLCLDSLVTSCGLMQALRRPEDPWSIAINLSAKQFGDRRLVERISDVLQQYRLTPDTLELEVTEGVLIQSFDEALQMLEALHELGCHISLDDFGTGYSSLQYLRVLPFDSIKIDKGFIDRIHTSPKDRTFVETIIDMTHNLGKTAIAEGVEEIGQLEVLRELGCDIIQGYLVSRPFPASELTAWIGSYDPARYAAGTPINLTGGRMR